MNKRSADETFVWRQKLELVVHEGEQLFLERRLSQTRILADCSDGLVHLLLEEMKCDIFLGLEIVEDGAFGDAGLARNRPGRRGLKALCLKEVQGGRDD